MSHGAVGDGVADDTTAFEAAINATAAGGVLYIPAGTYRIARNVTIRKPIVIRGDGMNLTTLYYPFSFGDLYPEALAANSRAFSFGPLMLTFSCSDSISSTTRLAYVAANVTRGDTVIPVTSTSGFSVGQTVRVAADDRNGKLVAYIYGNSLVSDWSDNVSLERPVALPTGCFSGGACAEHWNAPPPACCCAGRSGMAGLALCSPAQ